MELEKRLQKYISKKNLKLISKISKGYSSEVYLVQNAKKQKFALKIEKDKSPRTEMVKRETANLKLANSISIGPKLIDFDLKSRIILMEFIEGKTFSGWLFSYPSKKALSKFLVELFSQAQRLDKIGLDHGQLAGK
jgi:putative serine/threonine protein kinase